MNLKVIGGELKGRPLASPRGYAVRPTAGRVREAIFNILHFYIEQTIVLDLFAGTGAMGIEALSRGAGRALFIDNNRSVLTVIKRNIRTCGLEAVTETHQQDATGNLTGLSLRGLVFDLVFMDPPYGQEAVRPALAALAASGSLKPGSRIVVEHSPKEPIYDEIGRYKQRDQRRYGKTLVSFLEYMVD